MASNIFAIFLDKIPTALTSKETIKRHIEHLRKLDKSGCLILCGPFTDYPSGMIIVRAEDKEEATKIAQSDPFVQEKVRNFEIRSWLLANAENNYLS